VPSAVVLFLGREETRGTLPETPLRATVRGSPNENGPRLGWRGPL